MAWSKTTKPAPSYHNRGRHEIAKGRRLPNCALGDRIIIGENLMIGGCGGKAATSYTTTAKPTGSWTKEVKT